MAINCNITTSAGISVESAYSRVENVSINSKSKMAFALRSYTSPVSTQHFYEQLFVCNYDLGGRNVFAQAYAYVKSLPEFNGAVDV